jgi:hypothetical protein
LIRFDSGLWADYIDHTTVTSVFVYDSRSTITGNVRGALLPTATAIAARIPRPA